MSFDFQPPVSHTSPLRDLSTKRVEYGSKAEKERRSGACADPSSPTHRLTDELQSPASAHARYVHPLIFHLQTFDVAGAFLLFFIFERFPSQVALLQGSRRVSLARKFQPLTIAQVNRRTEKVIDWIRIRKRLESSGCAFNLQSATCSLHTCGPVATVPGSLFWTGQEQLRIRNLSASLKIFQQNDNGTTHDPRSRTLGI
jgi:hypothetical protein